MAILQGLLAMVLRSAGKILNTIFGWATTLLFGKVPQDRQYLLSAIGFGSVIWLAVALGIAFPSVGTFLLAFVPLPSWIDDTWVQLIMLALTVVIPALVGVAALYLTDPDDRPQDTAGKIRAVLKGYPYTVGLAVTLLMMCLVAPILKVRDLAKRWTSSHIPMIVEPEDYLEVVGDIERVLHRGGFDTVRTQASWMLRLPTKVFTFFAGGAIENLVAEQLTVLASGDLEALLHPSDLVLRGKAHEVMRAHALLTERLTFTKAYQTWSKQANEIEDRLTELWRRHRAAPLDFNNLAAAFGELQSIEHDLRSIKVDYEEWEVLFREKLVIERGLLGLAAGRVDRAASFEATQPRHAPTADAQERQPGALASVVVAGLVALILRAVSGNRDH